MRFKTLFRFLPAFFYCLTTSTSPQGPYSLISTTSSGYTRRRRSYVTPLSLSFKPGADDLEIPAQHHLRHSFLSSLWTFVGFRFVVCIRHPLFGGRHPEMKLGFVIEVVVALYLLFSPAQVRSPVHGETLRTGN